VFFCAGSCSTRATTPRRTTLNPTRRVLAARPAAVCRVVAFVGVQPALLAEWNALITCPLSRHSNFYAALLAPRAAQQDLIGRAAAHQADVCTDAARGAAALRSCTCRACSALLLTSRTADAGVDSNFAPTPMSASLCQQMTRELRQACCGAYFAWCAQRRRDLCDGHMLARGRAPRQARLRLPRPRGRGGVSRRNTEEYGCVMGGWVEVRFIVWCKNSQLPTTTSAGHWTATPLCRFRTCIWRLRHL
jgi:hypothetical protein